MSKDIVIHLLYIIGTIIALVGALFLPFLPGDFDAFAVTLSVMAQVFWLGGVILVPVGILWLIHEWRRHRLPPTVRSRAVRFKFAVVALFAGSLVMLTVSACAAVMPSVSLGVILIMVSMHLGLFFFSRIRPLKSPAASASTIIPTPLYLIAIPVIVALSHVLFMDVATESSRRRAIAACEGLIRDIEEYHARTGHYPTSLLSVWKDYRPRIMGISGYDYELNGKAYNLSFEQFTARIGTREIVMFNKLGEHTMTSHDQDLLRLSGEQLALQRGFYEAVESPIPQWKYFRFD